MSAVKPVETPEPLKQKLDMLGIAAKTVEHAPLFTVEDGADIRHHFRGGQTKNLFLKDKKGQLWLVVAEHGTKVDMNWLQKRLPSGRLSFGRPELMLEVLGVTPGSVTPFSLMNDTDCRVIPVLDKKLLDDFEILNFHPLSNDKTTEITPQDLLKFIDSCGHKTVIVDFLKG
ncbi:MAG: prolyl-tRNA synthetase associated domain-containing protein [Alphaproteobacteria bacterium]|nr:MAG: prolyl-tRNA synthetase associated domain-containing protein [Alphaproteobacteria bacterium]